MSDTTMTSQHDNCFDILPRDVMLEIYTHIPLSWPILRAVCRSWRHILTDMPIDGRDDGCDLSRCMNWAVTCGIPVNLGTISVSDIRKYIMSMCFDLLLGAKYTWSCDDAKAAADCYDYFRYAVHRGNYRAALQARMPGKYISEIVCTIFTQIIHNCRSGDLMITEIILRCQSTDLITKLHDTGFKFIDDIFDYVAMYDQMYAFHDIGYKWKNNIIISLIDRMNKHSHHVSRHTNYQVMIRYVTKYGQVITDDDYNYALNTGNYDAMKTLHDCGYKPGTQ